MHELRTIMKISLMMLAPAAIALASASASAQLSSDSVQDHTLSRAQRDSPQPTSATPLSRLLGAPQDDAENYLPYNHASSSTQDHPSMQGNRSHNQQATLDSPPSPLLGAPQDYEDSYVSGLDYGPEKQAGARDAANYRLTPVEQLLAPERPEGADASAAGAASQSNAVGTRVAGKRRESQEFEPVTTATPTSTSASQRDSLSDSTGSRTASAIYRSPW